MDFINENEKKFGSLASATLTKELKRDLTVTLIIALKSLEAEISYFFNDTQARIRKTVDVAFAHLQRQIVVDEAIRNQWVEKWDDAKREERFEKLGGVHLLYHKIWTFKVNAEGERTDLILSIPLDAGDVLYKSAEGLILTEWKKVKSQKQLNEKIGEAKNQADRYRKGSLASVELSNYCYLVMVSKNHFDIPDPNPFLENGTTYHIINIACSPKTPSKS
jgi:hypothetical protein